MFLRHPFLSFVTLAYLGLVGWITLGPQPFEGDSDGLIWRLLRVLQRYEATDWINYSRLEFGANVAMFLPIGLFFLLLFGRRLWWLSVLFGVGLTVSIEFAQLFLPGRVSDPRDLLANSAGAFIGVVAGLVLTASKARAIRRTQQQRRVRTS
ncbi:VanZ like protein [Glaciihabitans tibetensis]|uniref:VanZ like protein n=1 Tax=Glaciihabitans tibetensis TaxID=1266600 RepID=A0A2T0VHK5_9MICO|nr:VanZ family protein [Glaciihabitans tibetensis]PRY69680.1 VanZ like protein [Glaciihabitans tibetensis]